MEYKVVVYIFTESETRVTLDDDQKFGMGNRPKLHDYLNHLAQHNWTVTAMNSAPNGAGAIVPWQGTGTIVLQRAANPKSQNINSSQGQSEGEIDPKRKNPLLQRKLNNDSR